MGVIYSRALNQIRRFNVENRALRAIERKTPVSAPKHKTSKKYYDDILGNVEIKESLVRKDVKLDSNLKEVYVTSTNATAGFRRDPSILPQNRRFVEDDEHGFTLPLAGEIKEGQASLPQVLQFLANHQSDRQRWSASTIAKEYKLNEKTVVDILEHFKVFDAYVPKKPEKKGNFLTRTVLDTSGSQMKIGEDPFKDMKKLQEAFPPKKKPKREDVDGVPRLSHETSKSNSKDNT